MENITGLTNQEVLQKNTLGPSNQIIDAYTPSTLRIIFRNTFSLINIILIPLLLTLFYFNLRSEVLAFGTFALLNTIVSAYDELRIKKKLDKLKSQFQQTAFVIRDGKVKEIPANEIVEGDYIKAREGEGIIADGEVIYANYLQLDESALTGESNYISKEKGEKILAGSFVITGETVYIVQNVGKSNYLNKIGTEALKYGEKKSEIQQKGNSVILFLVIASISLGLFNFYLTMNTDLSIESRVLSLTTIIALIIPQTLIFLFTLTFAISITKLYAKGILIQKGGSIEELANINVICFDKTGTITTNNMKIIDSQYFNLERKDIADFYNSVEPLLVGVNKTQLLLNEHFFQEKRGEVLDFDQIPFTSKQKYSLVTGKINSKKYTLLFGAYSILEKNIDNKIKADLLEYVNRQELEGNRVLIGLFTDKEMEIHSYQESYIFDRAVIFAIEEELNPGIKDILNQLKDQNIDIRIISGDSLNSVRKIMQKLGIDSSDAVEINEDSKIEDLALNKKIFTRAKPEDKLAIINTLKKNGYKVAMVGDGINDVLSIKAADVSISMEHASKIARDVADIVLLKNDFSKIPNIFFEGENIIFNLKLSTKLFLLKSLLAIFIAIYFSLMNNVMPLHPASTLIFSFLGSSAPSYVLVFTRQKTKKNLGFFKEVIVDTLPQSLFYTLIVTTFYSILSSQFLNYIQINSALVLLLLSISIIYSLVLVWKSEKLKNIFLAGFVYILLFLVGTFQTLLPITQYTRDEERIILFGGVLLGSLILLTSLFKFGKPSKLKDKLLAILMSFIWVPLVIYFPFNDYYKVTQVSIDSLYLIFSFSILSLTGLILLNKLLKRFTND